MATIKPTLTLTSNASSATTDPGPLSVALSLNVNDSLTISKVAEAGTAAVTTTHTDNLIFDASAMNEVYIYLNNTSDSTVYVCNADAGTDANRFMALRAGEFAWFPWFAASTGTATDIYLDHSSGGTKNVEYWIFQI
tara:strand:+ start:62 stop:472 length:411 start_codon:yes stop_codon:yes gene_type:complete